MRNLCRHKSLFVLTVALTLFGALWAADNGPDQAMTANEVDSFFDSAEAVVLQVGAADMVQPRIAVAYLPLKTVRLQIEIEIPQEWAASLPLNLSIVPADIDLFLGRAEPSAAYPFMPVARGSLGRYMSDPKVRTLCGNRTLMAKATVQLASGSSALVPLGVGLLANTSVGMASLPGTADAEAEADGKVGVFSFACGFSVANCPIDKKCGLFGGGRCAIGIDPIFEERWCACF